ncbi:hypothetical protein BIZ94_gp081 [Pseudomonas phage vB_PaeM_MAG1]|uniref:Uncharacterized protein n=1 Tax=Pseudomonas phage vB_PaeM_MAG1 TaxID=1639815 RepID=A0A172CPG0_9CAUD|nr:hypothetical protein BIZ94_gp081 [Pseudomonas phage vB_PaeM_MAG1]ALA12061.1 hypothetical protein vB_PaeM_MAG1_081 [Pseudomonas phage vB_PaeM_MAG1]
MNIKVGDRVVLKDDCATYTVHAAGLAARSGREEELLAKGFIPGNWAENDAPSCRIGGLKGTVVMVDIGPEFLAVELDDFKNTRYAVVVVIEEDVIPQKDDTDHLLESPANAERLQESISQLQSGQVIEQEKRLVVNIVEMVVDNHYTRHYIIEYGLTGKDAKVVVKEVELVAWLHSIKAQWNVDSVQLEVSHGAV